MLLWVREVQLHVCLCLCCSPGCVCLFSVGVPSSADQLPDPHNPAGDAWALFTLAVFVLGSKPPIWQATNGHYFQIKSTPAKNPVPMGCNVKHLFWRQIHSTLCFTSLHMLTPCPVAAFGKGGILRFPFRKTRRHIAALTLEQMCRLFYLKRATVVFQHRISSKSCQHLWKMIL